MPLGIGALTVGVLDFDAGLPLRVLQVYFKIKGAVILLWKSFSF